MVFLQFDPLMAPYGQRLHKCVRPIIESHPSIVGHVETTDYSAIPELQPELLDPIQFVADVVLALHDEENLHRIVQLLVDVFSCLKFVRFEAHQNVYHEFRV